MLLGVGFGILNGIIAMAVPTWATGYALIIIVFYIISGITFVPDALPETIRYYLSFNPSLQTVEWMRSAYYEGYSTILDKQYTISFGALTIFLGLVIERFLRGHLLISRV
jgi:capsular polysaccharide transport system permease protein